MKALVDLDINLESKAVVELLISRLLPGALVERMETPGVKQRVIGYNKEAGYVIITTDEADEIGWCSCSPGDSVIIQGYEEVKKVYEYWKMITVSDDLADYIEEQVAAMKPRVLDPLGSIFNLNDPRVVEALGILLVGAEVDAAGSRGVVTEVNGLVAKIAKDEPLNLAQSDPVEGESDAEGETDADDELPTLNIGQLKVFKSY